MVIGLFIWFVVLPVIGAVVANVWWHRKRKKKREKEEASGDE